MDGKALRERAEDVLVGEGGRGPRDPLVRAHVLREVRPDRIAPRPPALEGERGGGPGSEGEKSCEVGPVT